MRIGGKKENETNSRTGRSAGRKLLLTTKKTGIHAGKLLLDLLYPPRCPICDRILSRRERLCCAGCEKKLPRVIGPVCMKCGKMIEREEDEYCEDCRKYAHVFTRGTAAFAYTGAMRHSVYRMKAENRRDYLDFYADAMAPGTDHRGTDALAKKMETRLQSVGAAGKETGRADRNSDRRFMGILLQKDESAENVEPKRAGKKSIRLLYTSEAGKMLSQCIDRG